ncbi:hypothetical protein OIO90_001675 [Microbotryomycetes sp. JL221]|nr:hypothetical protein OIO90_001675 [Microbotryomycetes sp. JL221]
MPVGHVRINNPKPDPVKYQWSTNPNITFINVIEELPNSDMVSYRSSSSSLIAQNMLQALAAQFKPIMKEWGFAINSLREAEWNPQFAGRNWNAGEVVEIVLRRPDGSFAPWKFLLMVMAHECAHIKEMNHSWAFQKVNTQLRNQVAALRARGYYGDGFWSSGHSLKYGEIDKPFELNEAPAFICGGANQKTRKRRRPRRTTTTTAPRGQATKLGQTGRQTSISKKPGSRVTRKGAFKGQGQSLNQDSNSSTFRRRANATSAIEARALAAERRLQAEQRDVKGKLKHESEDDQDDIKATKTTGDEQEETDTDEEEEEEDKEDWIKREQQEPLSLSKEEQDWLQKEMNDLYQDDDIMIVGINDSSTLSKGQDSSNFDATQRQDDDATRMEIRKNDKEKLGETSSSSTSSSLPRSKSKSNQVIVIDDSD